MSTGTDKLIAIFSAPGWKRFVESLASYRNRGKALPSSLTLATCTDEERRSYTRLLRLKKTPEGPSLRFDLGRIASALAAQGVEPDWPTLLSALCGPVSPEMETSEARRQA